MSVRIEPMPINGPLFEGAIAVYGQAFALPPYSDPGRGVELRYRIVQVHSHRPGYRAFVATRDGREIIGMIYGYRGEPGQWWHDTVNAALPPPVAEAWLSDSYELVEVAVAPSCQGQGVGTALIAALLDGRTEATCVLSTRTDSRAHRLYRRLGFEVVAEIPFAEGGPLFYIMGKRLRP
ncbi:MAG: GNAT family N-acetyltransferase [Dehalococcoidia bacterium]